MVTLQGGGYSVPHQLLGQIVWVRVHSRGEAEAVVVVHVGDTGPVALARHHRATPGGSGHARRALPTRPRRGAGADTQGR